MKQFRCTCGQRVYFDNTQCLHCGRRLGFDAGSLRMVALNPDGDRWQAADRGSFRRCDNDTIRGVCNWLLPESATGKFCFSCLLNLTIPDLSQSANLLRWRVLEGAKRRLLYSLLDLRLPILAGDPPPGPALGFRFLEDQRTNPLVEERHVLTGHQAGVITVHAVEADDDFRERMRVALNEPYRTLLGHFRHESGHFYFARLLAGAPRMDDFRRLFGDDRLDYDAALQRHYAAGPDPSRRHEYVSDYAQTHPLEDWAECFAHYLHIVDGLETAAANGLQCAAAERADFDATLDAWRETSIVLNEMGRSLGLPDAYPFVLTDAIVAKLRFVSSVVSPTAAPR